MSNTYIGERWDIPSEGLLCETFHRRQIIVIHPFSRKQHDFIHPSDPSTN